MKKNENARTDDEEKRMLKAIVRRWRPQAFRAWIFGDYLWRE